MSTTAELKESLKNDVDNSFNKLTTECSIGDIDSTIQKAEQQLNEELKHDISDRIKNGLERGFVLISLLKESKNESSRRFGVAALEYLIDPWDIIPDFISEDGFLDDIYVIEKAIGLIHENEVQNKKNESVKEELVNEERNKWLILKIGGAAGPHFAKRTKDLDILNGFQRKALFDIGRKHLYGYELSKKQHTFFETLVENAIKEGLLEYPCSESSCKYCQKLANLYSNKKVL